MRTVTVKQIRNWRWWARGGTVHYTLPSGHRTHYVARICHMGPALKKILAAGCEVETYITFSIGQKNYGVDYHEFGLPLLPPCAEGGLDGQ